MKSVDTPTHTTFREESITRKALGTPKEKEIRRENDNIPCHPHSPLLWQDLAICQAGLELSPGQLQIQNPFASTSQVLGDFKERQWGNTALP